MTISEAFRKGVELLKIAGNEAPAREAGALLCSVAHCGRTFLYAHGTDEFNDVLYSHYFTLLERRTEGVPLQYLTGMQEFMSLPFEVGPGVLVPRQETELLVETVINRCKGRSGSEAIHSKPDRGRCDISILDVGTGSGCIAVSLAYYVPGCLVTAIDRMPDAISIAQRNAVLNKVADRIHFIESNLFEAISAERFDIIVSNPPYIRTGDIKGLQKEVRCYEPMEALDGGSDGLDFYRVIIEKATGFLYEGGMLAFETGYDQAQDVAKIMSGSFENIQIYKDLAGIDRVVAGNCVNENIF
ncbi:MAG: peptide chain release factor N(5)-glutamine methyltransferase [Clostridiaceae bacterium]